VNCETQKEVDDYWEKLSAGRTNRQVRLMKAMMQMDKIDIGRLKQAYEQH
jgi:predicted 3-demethylubiquinone-9 3-methyltransferase (glyoxalase superfamily)